MARVTVEDCILNIPNRFELVIQAAHRAKQIAAGNPLTVDRDRDKDAVVSLREIAEQTISLDELHDSLVNSFCKRHAIETMEKNLAAETTSSDEVEEAFEDAKQHIAALSQGKTYGGLSFVEDNIETED